MVSHSQSEGIMRVTQFAKMSGNRLCFYKKIIFEFIMERATAFLLFFHCSKDPLNSSEL